MADRKYWKPSTEEQLAKIGDSLHLTIEELIEFLFVQGKKFDEYFVRESARINSHILGCASCRKRYETLLLISEVGEVYTLVMGAVDDLKNESASQEEKKEALAYICCVADNHEFR